MRVQRRVVGHGARADLATAAGIGVGSVTNIEGGLTEPNPRTILALRKALEDAGVILLALGDMRDGSVGVRLRKTEP